MRHPEEQYLDTLDDILTYGERVPNRTGIDTIRILGVTHRYDFKDGFPLFTTKRTWFKGIKHELLWMLSGSSNIKYLVDNGVNIWNKDAHRCHVNFMKSQGVEPQDYDTYVKNIKEDAPFAKLHGELGPVYGTQWRAWGHNMDNAYWPGIDQIARLVDSLTNNPQSRRHILSAWNVEEVDHMGLPPCHVMSQYTISKGKLWCHMYQRSCDMFLGVPFNVGFYALLTHLLAQVCSLEPGGFIHTMHDTHIYANHVEQAQEQITRKPKPFPQLVLTPNIKDIDEFTALDMVIENYEHHPPIKAELNVG
jgi:thymidylate synthase